MNRPKNIITVFILLLSYTQLLNAQSGKEVFNKAKSKVKNTQGVESSNKEASSDNGSRTTYSQPNSKDKVPRASKAFAPYNSYLNQIDRARAFKGVSSDKYAQYVRYAEKSLKKAKSADSTIDFSGETKELAEMRREVNGVNKSNAESATELKELRTTLMIYQTNWREIIGGKVVVISKYNIADKGGFKSLAEDNRTRFRRASSSIIYDAKAYNHGNLFWEIAMTFDFEEITQLQNKHNSDPSISKNEKINFNREVFSNDLVAPSSSLLDEYLALSPFSDNMVKVITAANQANKSGEIEVALANANTAIQYCKGILLLSPNNPQVKSLLSKAQKTMDEIMQSMSTVFTSDFHKNNVGKMLFSTNPFKAGSESDSDISNAFKSGQTIYATVYLMQNVAEQMKNVSTYATLLVAVGSEVNTPQTIGRVYIPKTKFNQSYFQFAIVPNIETYDVSEDAKHSNSTLGSISKMLSEQGPKTFEILVSMSFGDGKGTNFKGAFSLDLSTASTRYDKVIYWINEKMIDGRRMPKAAQSNPNLETQALALVNSKSKKGQKYSNCRIVSSDWKLSRHWLTGIILQREISIYVIGTYPDGHCEIQAFDIYQTSDNGVYSRMKLDASQLFMGTGEIRCKNKNK